MITGHIHYQCLIIKQVRYRQGHAAVQVVVVDRRVLGPGGREL